MREFNSNALDKARVEKGWVREEILASLSNQPSTLTEISRKLGVSKSTASYHLSKLLDHGIIEQVGSREGRGGVKIRRFGLREGTRIILPGLGDEDSELQRLRETFDIETIAWQGSAASIGVQEVQVLLYKLFLNLFRITRTEHRALMIEYGSRAGTVLARQLSAPPSRKGLANLGSFLEESGIADMDMVDIPDSSVSVIISSVCIGSDNHPSNSCYFLEGMVEGMVRSKLGAGVRVGRVQAPKLSGCCFAVGRVKSLELDWLSDAILSSPSYSAINRRPRKV